MVQDSCVYTLRTEDWVDFGRPDAGKVLTALPNNIRNYVGRKQTQIALLHRRLASLVASLSCAHPRNCNLRMGSARGVGRVCARSLDVLCIFDCSSEGYVSREGTRTPRAGGIMGKTMARRAYSRQMRMTGAVAGSRCGKWQQRAVEVDIACCLEGVECVSGGDEVMR